MPIWKMGLYGVQPCRYPGLSCIDFLPATHKAYHHRPVHMPIQIGNQELGFRLGEARAIFFPLHKVPCFSQIPRTLGFVKDDDMIYRRSRISKTIIPKMVDILNKGLHFLPDNALSRPLVLGAQSVDLITNECFSKNRDQRAVPGKENSVGRCCFISSFGGDIQANQCFPGTRYPSDETDCFLLFLSSFVDQLFESMRCDIQVSRTGVMACDILHGVFRVESSGGLDDGRSWPITTRAPSLAINYIALNLSDSQLQNLP